ncbi:MAG: class II aldolase/adducin family protein, partial [Clostridiales bacterium]|nr:class II aldolase/adducin family protein [Clostridiales bacterium]
AYYRMETLEHFAKVTLTARQLGKVYELNREQIDACIKIRKDSNFPGNHPGYKKYSK